MVRRPTQCVEPFFSFRLYFFIFRFCSVQFYKRVSLAYGIKNQIVANLWEVNLYWSDNMISEEMKGYHYFVFLK